MVKRLQNRGFSLAEVMMAAGILAIGFVFIAGVFPVGVKLTAIATEQTIAPIVADEAFAKIRLYGIDPNHVWSPGYVDFAELSSIHPFDPCEFGYPSTDISPEPKRYHWSALCGLRDDGNVHVTVFVTRISGAATSFLYYDEGGVLQTDSSWPLPVRVEVTRVGPARLEIVNAADERDFINGGSTIADDATGSVYRVLRRTRNDVIVLDRDWRDWQAPLGDYVWVVPPAVGSSRYPGIGIYQRVVSF